MSKQLSIDLKTRCQIVAHGAGRMGRKTAQFIAENQRLVDTAVLNLAIAPFLVTISGAVLSAAKISAGYLPVVSICWTIPLMKDVANAARMKILKELTKEGGFLDLIEMAGPSVQKSIEEIYSELVALEKRGIFMFRREFNSRMDEFIDEALRKTWKDLEPKIENAEKKARLRAWIEKLEAELAGVEDVQKRAADVLRETVREILFDFNGKVEGHLGQSIPGEIEGEREDKAMHILAETIVEKIMDRNLDYDIAIRRVIAEVVKEGIIDPQGQESLVKGLLEAATSNDGTRLKKLFDDFRKQYLDTGSGTLQLPRKAAIQVVGEKKAVRRTEGLITKEAKKDGSSN